MRCKSLSVNADDIKGGKNHFMWEL